MHSLCCSVRRAEYTRKEGGRPHVTGHFLLDNAVYRTDSIFLMVTVQGLFSLTFYALALISHGLFLVLLFLTFAQCYALGPESEVLRLAIVSSLRPKLPSTF